VSQLTNELRPGAWDRVVGQEDNIELLKGIIKDPADKPKVLIFEGEMGTGKTSCARIFAREINGMTEQGFETEAKGVYYVELDSSEVAFDEDNLEYMLTNNQKNYWKVVLLDEIQAKPHSEQTKLLKPLEQLGDMVFVILATTDISKILKPLRSRGLELRFAAIPYEAILAHLDDVERICQKPISREAKEYIAYRAHGHMRDAHMLADKYYIMGDESFMRNAVTSTDNLCGFFLSALVQKPDAVKYLNALVDRPLAELREDFDEFIIKCAQETIGIPSNNNNIKRVAEVYGDRFKAVIDTYFQQWVGSMFKSDTLFHLSMMNFYKIVKNI